MSQVLRRGPDGELVWTERSEAAPLEDRGPEVAVAPNVDFVSHQIPFNHPAAKRKDKRGRAVFTSIHEVNDFIVRARDMGDSVQAWDGLGGIK